ncbi:hypothetical protein PR048_033420 [Dryococelus australis]|uniref:tRNA (guanine-N(7)-)-methyltransferase non-catalytic subunit n=1 Tax=Dryococelus australis TaxID=614101 RepID=A0ABQ9G087_9NEOP|nr:hypothetical protein PR048_033420 [Dryococelus australis]
MVVLATSENIFVVCTEHVLGVNSTKKEHSIIDYCALVATSSAKTTVEANCSQTVTVDCVSLSLCGKWLVVCYNKSVSLLQTDRWCVVSVRELARVSNSVKFSPSGRHIVVADRSGNAYMYSAENPEQPGKLLLGHTSMLVDILVTTDEKFIVTCDRDEKIRVSNFPNAYIIHSFCLGHEKFVSCIAELPHDTSVLVSGSGDGTIRFWDFCSGAEIYFVGDDFSKEAVLLGDQQVELVNSAIQSCEAGSCGEVEVLPVRCFNWFKKDANSSVGCVCVGGLSCCFVFCASGRKDILSVRMIQKISLQSEPWIASFSGSGVLWVLQKVEGKTACAFAQNTSTSNFEENCGLDSESEYILSTINSKWEFFSDQESPKVLSILYKRMFDDVQEYKDRKKARLDSKIKNM